MPVAFGGLKDRLTGALTGRSLAMKLVAAVAALTIVGGALFWLIDKLFLIMLSRSYVDQIAVAFNFNKHLAEAISLIVFVALCYFIAKLFSLSASKRRVGYAGIISLLVANSLTLWQGTKDHYFEASGAAAKCYVMTRDGVRYLEKPGIDPITGKPCMLVTPEAMDKLLAYSGGRRPERIEASDPTFFDPRTGEPIVWFTRGKSDEIKLFDLMGFDPETAQELAPIKPEIVTEWKRQQRAFADRPPQRVDPERFVFFDTKSGKAKGWFWLSSDGDYEFYDNAGYQPNTGEKLTPVTREVLASWRDKSSRKCYTLTRTTLKYGSKVGVDPATGLDCKPITASLLERLREYEHGNRAKRVTASEPVFFDPRSGDPTIWYGKEPSGQIQLFDMIGFHPETGQELLPITPDVATEWKRQTTIRTRKPPQRVDVNTYAPFDPVDGRPRVWFWRGRDGMWEFYDNDGYQPGTGDKLSLISRESLQVWARETEEQRKRVENAKLADRKAIAEADAAAQKARDAAAAQAVAVQQAGGDCDRLAANPTDSKKSPEVVGAEYRDLKDNAAAAIASCAQAMTNYPAEARFRYQLARALEFSDPKRSAALLSDLIHQNYAAAYDNLGGILLREKKDVAGAIKLYDVGLRMGDPGAMMSIAWLVKKGLYPVPNGDPDGFRLKLISRAAERGHSAAKEMLETELAAYRQRLQDEQNQRDTARAVMGIFGGALGAATHR